MQKEFRITVDSNICLDVDIVDGNHGKTIDFVPTSTDCDWVASSLYYGDEVVMEWISYDGLRVHDEALASQWLRETYPGDMDWDPADKFREVAPDPDRVYPTLRREAEGFALRDWVNENDIVVYRDDLRGFDNEFELIFVFPGAEYTPCRGEYEIEPEDVARYYSRYPDGVTEDYSFISVIAD